MASDEDKAKTIFLNALEMTSEAERQAYVQSQCEDDSQLLSKVEGLLQYHQRMGDFLESPAVPPGATIDMPMVAERPGTFIGPYKLLEKLGEGGMGVVFLAEQKEPVERQVALKIIRPGMDSQRVIQRFEAERQALAVMDHPNVAKVLDAGTTESARPYFVMELVQGTRITKYCDAHQLTVRERLELFIPVCQAVQHAHQKGVIHRDIKPSNILVTEFDGRPVPKVIDFGVAKAIDQRATQKQMSTQYGQIVGTLEYMSPEQARLSQQDVDTRSDVYSLGAVLYELLTGITPFDKGQLYAAALDEALLIIEQQEPSKPSTRLSSSDSLPSVAALRHTEPQRLTGTIRGELDWIVMKSLEKERSRRYESAASLAGDIANYLHDQPVIAGPPSAAYRVRKFARRNKGVLATVGLVALAMILGTGASCYQAYRARSAERLAKARSDQLERQRDRAIESEADAKSARDEATSSEQQAEIVTQFLIDVFRSPDPEREGRTVTVAELLDQAVTELNEGFQDEPLIKARLLSAIARAYSGLGLYREALQLNQRELELAETKLGHLHQHTLRALHNLGTAHFRSGNFTEAVAALRDCLERHQRVFGPDHRNTLLTMTSLAGSLSIAGQKSDAIELLEETLERQQDELGPQHAETLRTMTSLAHMYSPRKAEVFYEEALKLCREALGVDHLVTTEAMRGLANVYSDLGRHREAAELLEQSLSVIREKYGDDHPATLGYMNDYALILVRCGKAKEAAGLFVRVLDAGRLNPGEDHPDTLITIVVEVGLAKEGIVGRHTSSLARCSRQNRESLCLPSPPREALGERGEGSIVTFFQGANIGGNDISFIRE